MPIPSSINDLSTTAASNSPGTTEDLGTADDYFRVYASYIAALRDVVLSGTANLSTANLTYAGTLTGSTNVINIGAGQIYKNAAGNVGLGTSSPLAKIHTLATASYANAVFDSDANSTPAFAQYRVNSSAGWEVGMSNAADNYRWRVCYGTFGSGTEKFAIDSGGNVVNTPSNTPPTLTANGQINITPTSNTNVRISYRGSDGTTRTADITLA